MKGSHFFRFVWFFFNKVRKVKLKVITFIYYLPLITSLTGVRVMPMVGERGSPNTTGHSLFISADVLDTSCPTLQKYSIILCLIAPQFTKVV